MIKREKWMEEADELISQILDLKESKKANEMELDNAKAKLAEILEEHDLQEYQGTTGKCNFVDSERKGLVKDEVESAVTKVNNGEISHIDMKDITKDIKVHFLSVKEGGIDEKEDNN